MKAFITVVDDNGRIFCKDQMIVPFKEEIIGNQYPTKETSFKFTIRELVDCQLEDDTFRLNGRKE